MKTRPYLLIVLCILVNKITIAQSQVPPISGWDMDEKSGSYIFKPGKVSGDTKEFLYEIMPVEKGEGQTIEEWFKSAIDKDVKESGFNLPAGGKKNITTNQTIISFSTELTDKKGKPWYVTYVAYQLGSGENRLARVISSPDVKYYASHMRPVADHIGNLARHDASVTVASKQTKGSHAHNKQDNKTSAAQADMVENGLRSQEINGILIHLDYTTNADGKMVRNYRPYLVLNDGSIYGDPVLSPYSLDVAQSKQKEPQKWGTWKLKNNIFTVEWTATKETEKWFKNWFWATPAAREEKLEGSFMTVTGTENGSVKSAGNAYASKNIFFNKDGQFTLTGGDNGNAAVPASEFKKFNEAGTYTLNDYSMELRFNNGTVIRRIFYFYLQGSTHFGIGNAAYAPKASAESPASASN
ncbi:hypothetical protein [Longitalea luteola]|uniref:hypothetical protein n=1 Tax=Longitalea luteola TaxID=2812563 RepID=UPI001A962E1E|nr:hypothetical protein [Longitalea luteola]